MSVNHVLELQRALQGFVAKHGILRTVTRTVAGAVVGGSMVYLAFAQEIYASHFETYKHNGNIIEPSNEMLTLSQREIGNYFSDAAISVLNKEIHGVFATFRFEPVGIGFAGSASGVTLGLPVLWSFNSPQHMLANWEVVLDLLKKNNIRVRNKSPDPVLADLLFVSPDKQSFELQRKLYESSYFLHLDGMTTFYVSLAVLLSDEVVFRLANVFQKRVGRRLHGAVGVTALIGVAYFLSCFLYTFARTSSVSRADRDAACKNPEYLKAGVDDIAHYIRLNQYLRSIVANPDAIFAENGDRLPPRWNFISSGSALSRRLKALDDLELTDEGFTFLPEDVYFGLPEADTRAATVENK